MHHHKIKVEKTAHYYTLGNIHEGTKYLWFVTHGYGQLASNIIRKFEHFDEAEHAVVAPEALNRFYWDMYKNIVGASWMTRQDRLDEIDDYSHFLDLVFKETVAQLPKDCQIIFFGFSQGCATQIRWILRGLPSFHHLVMWGGIFPEDIDYQPFISYFNDKKLHFVCGDNDEFVTDERIGWNQNFAKENNLPLNYYPFIGKHEILTDVLNRFFEKEISSTK
jgi:predicted esterase